MFSETEAGESSGHSVIPRTLDFSKNRLHLRATKTTASSSGEIQVSLLHTIIMASEERLALRYFESLGIVPGSLPWMDAFNTVC